MNHDIEHDGNHMKIMFRDGTVRFFAIALLAPPVVQVPGAPGGC